MNRPAGIALVRQIGLGIALVSVVSLLTVVFTVLGTIICSALVGVMCGSTRQWRWQTILVSLVFPAATLTFMRIPESDGHQHQNLIMGMLTFGLFWVTYGLTYVLVGLESRQADSTDAEAQAPALGEGGPEGASPFRMAEEAKGAEHVGGSDSWKGGAGLETIQGKWTSQTGAVNGHQLAKLIEILQDRFALSVADADGQWRRIGQGRVEVEKLGPFQVLKILSFTGQTPLLGTLAADGSWRWIFKVAEGKLTVASHFEETAQDSPAAELYARVS